MADSGIRKVTIPISSAVAVSEKNDNDPSNNFASRLLYLFRYRITSDDGVKYSAWSPKYTLESPKIIDIYNNKNELTNKVISTGIDMTATWNIPSGLINNTFDIYTRWGTTIGQTEYSITGATLSSGTITFTTSVAHNLTANAITPDKNDRVAIYSMDNAVNGSYIITGTPSSTTFTVKTSVASIVTTTGKIKRITFDSTQQTGAWTYSATTTSNNFHIAIPSGFIPAALGTSLSGTTPAQYIYFLDIYAQLQANPKQISYSTLTTIPTAILNPIGKIFSKVVSTYTTTVDSGKLA